MTLGRAVTSMGATSVLTTLAPAVTAIGPVRRAVSPRLSGAFPAPHIALTFDDGPDPQSTPAFLDLLALHDRAATFFVLGKHAAENGPLLRRMVAEGHEVALHGWSHVCLAAIPLSRLTGQLRAGRETIEDITGTPVTWYRPPYGVLTTPALLAARSLGLTPVLWTAWGRDWERAATPDSILRTVLRTLRPGGTILLHDTDRHSSPGSWHRTLAATEALLSGPLAAGQIGPLRDHRRR